MGIAITKLFAELLFWIFGILDSILEMFQVLCGIRNVTVQRDGVEVEASLIDVFLESSAVTKAFLSLFVISIFICAICVVVAIVKNVLAFKSGGERKNPVKIAGQGLASIFVSIAMAAIMVCGITMSNVILQQVDKATNQNNTSMSRTVFAMCVSQEVLMDYNNPIYEPIYVRDANGNIKDKVDKDGNPVYVLVNGEKVILRDENGKRLPLLDEHGNKQKVEDPNTGKPMEDAEGYVYVWQYEIEKEVKLDSNGEEMYTVHFSPILDGNKNPIFGDAWNLKDSKVPGVYYSAEDIVFMSHYDHVSKVSYSKTSVDQVFGVHKKDTLGLFELADKEYTKPAMVDLDSFNMFLAYLGAVMMLVALISMLLGLVKRVYDIVILFLMLPLIAATIPLDDGARFKTWRETVVSKVILAYGSVLAVNVFLLIAPLVVGITISTNGLLNAVFRILMLIGGALTISGGQVLMARVMGTSAEESREMAQSARALLGGAMTAGGMLGAAKRGIFGGRNKYGVSRKGALGGAAKAGGFVANAVGNTIGGGAYRDGVAKIGKGLGAVGGKISDIGRVNRRHDGGEDLDRRKERNSAAEAKRQQKFNDAKGQPLSKQKVLTKHEKLAKQRENQAAWRDGGLIGRAQLGNKRHNKRKK